MAAVHLALVLLGVLAIAHGLVVPPNQGTYPKSCRPPCGKYCEFDYELDHNGCPLCQCRNSPVCPHQTCYNQCPYGFIYRNGCQTCECSQSAGTCQQRCLSYCQAPHMSIPPHGCNCNCGGYVQPRPTY